MSESVSSGTFAPSSSDDRNLAFVVYGLLFLSPFLWGFTGVIGVVIAYVRRSEAAAILRSHFEFQIRTFWIAAAILILAVISFLFGVGYLFSDLFNAATNGGEGWDAWQAAAFDADDVTLHGEMVVGFIASLVLAAISSLWLFAASLFGMARLAGANPIGRA